ncbi:histidine kinase [Arsukibacterium ikkense]|uniref:Histidine kinase n=1 Tax=Arsukibacterium ikkense TaxID=336831 RepID=A0A0M2V888_9GAMM|nr:response regulator [Arsukibacterium ikkense]KKO46826.1 histidine kinase [Arsukibacterium ikkense]
MTLTRNIHVLVVDDVILMCDFLYGVVNKVAGCRAIKALDGKAAAEYLGNERIDLLITDIEMKAPSGLELAQRVRSGMFSQTPYDIPIIIFSGNAYREVIEQSIAFDVNDFLVKPITSAGLTAKIQYHLQHKKVLKPMSHYAQLVADVDYAKAIELPTEDRAFSVAIVRELPEPKADDVDQREAASKAKEKKEKKEFLVWPEHATTGYFQLDRRMRNFAFNVSCFHNVFVENCKPVAIESERKRACEAADYLFHISKNIKQKDNRRDFWLLFQQRLDKLQPHVKELNSINIKHHSQVLVLLKRLAYWWMQTCSRPLIQINEVTHETADE